MISLSEEDEKQFVLKLLESGNGDAGRLNYILSSLNKGKRLYHTDQNYLAEKFCQKAGLIKIIQADENLLAKIQKLLKNGDGDYGRLRHILETLCRGKSLYSSDQKYLENKLGEKIPQPIKKIIHDMSDIFTSPQKLDYSVILEKISVSTEKIAFLESKVSVTSEKMVSLESEVSRANENIESMNEKITGLDQKTSSVFNKMSSLENHIESSIKVLSTLRESMSYHESRIDRLIEDVESIGPQLSTISEAIPDIESRILMINEKIIALAETAGKKTTRRKASRITDPHFSKELTDQITTQPDFTFTTKTRPPQGQEQSLPIQFRAIPPPLILNEYKTATLLQKMKEMYGTKEAGQSTFDSNEAKKIKWMRQLYAEFRTKPEWDIILFLYKSNGNLTQIVDGVNSQDRDNTSQLIDSLRENGIISIARSRKRGSQVEYEYALAAKVRDTYFPKSFDLIGNAHDVSEVASKALQYYIEKEFFVSLANRDLKNGKMMCDMIAYDYDNDHSISIKIESKSEADSHPEQVQLYMTTWKSLGFAECHIWSKSDEIQKIKEKLETDGNGVTVFTV